MRPLRRTAPKKYFFPAADVVGFESSSFLLVESDSDFVGGDPEDFTEIEGEW